MGNSGIQDLKHSEERTQSYKSCSYEQICDSNMNLKMRQMVQNSFTFDLCLLAVLLVALPTLKLPLYKINSESKVRRAVPCLAVAIVRLSDGPGQV